MKSEIHFSAPWGMTVKVVTVIAFMFFIGASIVLLAVLPNNVPPLPKLLLVLTPIAILVGTLPFMIRGYVLSDDELLIERLGWRNHVPLRNVVSATPNDRAIWRSIRLCGCGGLFGFFGWFWKRGLGVFRAYATDPKNSVVMKLTNRTIVITPDDPQRFIAELDARRTMSAG